MVLLVRTPAPHLGESLLGFVLRVSQENGYDTPWHVLRLAGIDQGQMLTAGLPIEKLAGILNRPAHSLKRLAYQKRVAGATEFKILNHTFGRSLKSGQLRLRTPAICPRCVQESGYIDTFWDLNAAIACPRHHCRPLSFCHSCEAPIRWFRPGLLICQCGADLTNMPLLKADRPLCEFMGVIYAKLHSQPFSALPNVSSFPLAKLKSMPLRSLLKMLDALGSQNLLSQEQKEAPKSDLVEKAIEPLAEWPTGYYQMLERLGAFFLDAGSSGTGLRKQFEPFYETLFKRQQFSKDIEFLREEFINFGLLRWGAAVVDSRLHRSMAPPSNDRFITKTEFSRRFGLWRPTMDQMIADGSLVTTTIPCKKGHRVVVDLEQSQRPIRSSGVMSEREAAKYIGLPVSVINHLRQCGLYVAELRTARQQSWHKEDVERFLSRCLEDVPLLVQQDYSNITLGAALRLKLRDSAAKADIAAAALDGRLEVVGRVDDNLAGLVLDNNQVQQFVALKVEAINGGSLSFQEAAARTGLDFTVIDSAVKAGLLTKINWKGRWRIPSEAVQQFNEHYVVLARLSKELGTTSTRLMKKCRQRDVPVIALARSSGVPDQPIVSREYFESLCIESDLISHPLSTQA